MNKKFRIVLVGDSNVGKTTVINFLRKNYNLNYENTIFNAYTHFLFDEENNIKYDLEIFDTSGNRDYLKVRKPVYYKANLIILCFAINNVESLYNINSFWIPEINENCPNCAKILLGLKNDMRYNQKKYDEKNILSYNYSKKIADSLNIKYFEFGKIAKDSDNIDDTLQNLSSEISYIFLKGLQTINKESLNQNNKKNKNKCILQ